MQVQRNLPAELLAITTARCFVRPLTREQFDEAIAALGGRRSFKRPRNYGVWTKDGLVCVYPPAEETNLAPALASLK